MNTNDEDPLKTQKKLISAWGQLASISSFSPEEEALLASQAERGTPLFHLKKGAGLLDAEIDSSEKNKLDPDYAQARAEVNHAIDILEAKL